MTGTLPSDEATKFVGAKFAKHEVGAAAVEYDLIAAIVGVGIIVALQTYRATPPLTTTEDAGWCSPGNSGAWGENSSTELRVARSLTNKISETSALG